MPLDSVLHTQLHMLHITYPATWNHPARKNEPPKTLTDVKLQSVDQGLSTRLLGQTTLPWKLESILWCFMLCAFLFPCYDPIASHLDPRAPLGAFLCPTEEHIFHSFIKNSCSGLNVRSCCFMVQLTRTSQNVFLEVFLAQAVFLLVTPKPGLWPAPSHPRAAPQPVFQVGNSMGEGWCHVLQFFKKLLKSWRTIWVMNC